MSMIEVVHTRRQVERKGYGVIMEVERALPEVEKYTITTQVEKKEDNVMDCTMLGWLVDKEEMKKLLIKWMRGSKLRLGC